MDSNDVAVAVGAAEAKGLSFSDSAVEIQTDKDRIKATPCVGCSRPLIVSTFYVAANARCSECKGGATVDGTGEVVAPVAGKTDPARVKDMATVLVNPTLARALCPVHPDDEEHEMELKWIGHAEHYGPKELIGFSAGKPEYRQIAVGETVMHQCLRCRATVVYSTTAQTQFRAQNEVRSDRRVDTEGWVEVLGEREEGAA